MEFIEVASADDLAEGQIRVAVRARERADRAGAGLR